MEARHYYLLPNGGTAESQKEACEILGIGRQAFRNAVKRGDIRKIITNTSKPNGYEHTNNTL